MMTRRWWLAGVALAACLSLLAGRGAVPADEKKADKAPSKEEEQAAAAVAAVERIIMADQLVGYARQHKFPEALLTAVDIYRTTPVQPFTGKVEGGEAVRGEQASAKEWAELLQEARKMRPEDKDMAALVDRHLAALKETPRGVVSGGLPNQFTHTVRSPGELIFSREFVPTSGACTVQAISGSLPSGTRMEVRENVTNRLVSSGPLTARFSVPRRNFYHFRIIVPAAGATRNITLRITVS